MIKDFIRSSLVNYQGWSNHKKIVVFESDDWGSIRIPSDSVYQNLKGKGLPVGDSPYLRYDRLEMDEDLMALFEVLKSVKDKSGKHPSITANTVVGNPDFHKIKASHFQHYYFEPFLETYKKYPGSAHAFELMLTGIKEGLWFPQFHGREHINVNLWLRLLQEGHKNFLEAFEQGFWGLSTDVIPMRRSIQAAFDYEEEKDLDFQKESIKSGLDLFYNIFGFRSKSFIANNYIWSPQLDSTFKENGVDIFQGMKYQKLPLGLSEKRKMIRHFTGEMNDLNQIFLVRNGVFEPSLSPNEKDNVGHCLRQIQNSFLFRKPAIITVHRVNFMGGIVEKNRKMNLFQFKNLLKSIVKSWPDVEFYNSSDLGKYISQNRLI